jgi:hypothetical protein
LQQYRSRRTNKLSKRETTMRGWTTAAALMLGIAAGCASGRLPDARGLDVIVKAKPTSIAPDAAGARSVQTATGCETEFVRVLATGAIVLRLWPTRNAPDVQQCLAKVKSLPGVEYATPDAPLKAT